MPQAGKPTFEIGTDEIEIGMGIHGEPGVWRGKLKPVDEIVDELIERLMFDMPLSKGDRISILVNGAGATPIEELYLDFRCAHALLADKGVEIICPMVGNYATSMEMAGASITLMKLDDELESLLHVPAENPFWRNL